jgi:putative membrane protein
MHLRNILAVIGSCVFFAALAAAQSSKLSKADKTFLDAAADANMTEAHIGQMAEARSYATDVRHFGQKLTKDHTDAYETLRQLAHKVGATIPTEIDVRRDRTVEELARLKGRNFDHRFLREEVRDHEKALAQFRREAEHGKDADVKAYAAKMIPILENHLHTAESLAESARHIG